ncbi:MAG: nucleotidyltransferase domain-containing protein [candidate division NC10 bacterium]|nr:nucleotidyltransferase domain-containing protein [candidate division NC10 bacterium]
MSTARPLDISSALFGKTRRNVLALFFAAPDTAFYLRQIVREAGGGVGAIQRELQHLAAVGILERTVQGRQVFYQVNRATPVFAELQGLLLKTAGLADVLRTALAPLKDKIEQAFVYGSQAAGTAINGSDVDLLVVGDLEELALHRAIRDAETRLKRTVNYSLLTPEEFARRKRARGGFLARVLRGPTISLLGEGHGA